MNAQNLVMSKSTNDILPLFSRPPNYTSRSDLLSKYFSSIFGDIIASAFCIPQNFPQTELTPSSKQLLSELLVLVRDESFELKPSKFLTKKILKKILDNLHPSCCPFYSSTFASHSRAITESFCARCKNLMYANRIQIIGSIICWEPSFSPLCDWSFKDLILYLLKIEYSSDLIDYLTHTKEFRSSLAKRNSKAQQIKLNIELDFNMKKDISLNWPAIPSEETIYRCLAAYRAGTAWQLPHPCACCARTQHGTHTEAIPLDDPESLYHDLHLELLKRASSCPPFTSPSIPQFSNLLLHSSGFSFNEVGEANLLHLCKECISYLRSNKLPRFALANNFYRGELPEEFKDLTWVEDMACAIYRNTAHISCIYQLSDS